MLYFDGRICSSEYEVAEAFSAHFERPATPSESPEFDSSYKNQVEFDTLLIEPIADRQS